MTSRSTKYKGSGSLVVEADKKPAFSLNSRKHQNRCTPHLWCEPREGGAVGEGFKVYWASSG